MVADAEDVPPITASPIPNCHWLLQFLTAEIYPSSLIQTFPNKEAHGEILSDAVVIGVPRTTVPHGTLQVALRSWFISGNLRIRLPIAAKIALSTAGAATAIVGSPTPPQKSPVGTTTTSTLGISSMRITL